MNTTIGEWVVVPATGECAEGIFLHKVIAVGSRRDELVALVPNMADAALIAASTGMLETLISIHETLNASKQVIDLIRMNELVSNVFEKIAAESGEM